MQASISRRWRPDPIAEKVFGKPEQPEAEIQIPAEYAEVQNLLFEEYSKYESYIECLFAYCF